MPLLPRAASLWRNLFHKGRVERELAEEVESWLEMQVEMKIEEGMSREAARRAALIELGGAEQVKERVREVRMGHSLETVCQDLRFGLRMLRRDRGFAALAVLMLALGIGANTAVFSAVNTLLLRPLPVEDSDRLVFGFGLREGFDPFWTTLLEYSAYRERNQSFASSGIGVQQPFNLIGSGEPERVQGAAVMADYLNTLGVNPVVGRSFTAEDDLPGGQAVALIGYGLGQRRFGGDSRVVSQPLDLEGRNYTVIGIMPPGFDMPVGAEIWVSLQVNLHNLPVEQQDIHNNLWC